MADSIEIRVPDIGDFEEVEVVEVLVSKGERVAQEDPLVSIESDKATMEIPSPRAGVVLEVRVAEGDRVSEGSVIALLEAEDAARDSDTSSETSETAAAPAGQDLRDDEDAADAEPAPEVDPEAARAAEVAAAREAPNEGRPLSAASAHPVPDRSGVPHASPLVRRTARELGVPLETAEGTGPAGRILVDDLRREVRERFASDRGEAGGFGALPAAPSVDHAAFGPVREEALSRIQKVSGPNLHRSWLGIPHVTQHDEADVTELEAFRRARKAEASERGLKLSPLVFVMKAVASVLRDHPALRSSIEPDAGRRVIKDYCHLGIAVDTDEGLVVPVVRDVDRKGVFELAAELAELSERARARKLAPDDLRGAVFTISSLGGIGGSAFTPIVNAPQVAILGLSRQRLQPVWRGPLPGALGGPRTRAETATGEVPIEGAEGRFEPRWMLPLSLSYDHRAVDGAAAVRFTTQLADVLSDPIRLLL